MQGGVEGRGVEAEAGGVRRRTFRKAHLGVDGVVVAPGGGQGPEGGPVVEAGGRVPLVQAGEVEFLGVLRRPCVQPCSGRGGAVGEQTGGVQGPGLVGGRVLGARVDLDRAGPGRVRGADGDLDPDAVGGRQHQGDLQGQFLQ